MAQGLNPSDVVNVTVSISPLAAQYRNFGAGNVIGSTAVIDTNERIRRYSDLDAVAGDYGTSAPEYLAARLHFSQVPQPSLLYISRWAQTATAGLVRGGVLTPSQQLLSNFTALTSGTLTISVDGTSHSFTAVNLSSATNLNGVASLVQTAVAATFTGATVKWDAASGRFTVTSGTTGTASAVSYGTGTIATAMGLVSAAASVPVNGIAAETLASCVQTLADMSGDWYAATVATVTPPDDADYIAAAEFIEGSARARIFGITIPTTTVLDQTTSADLASSLKTLKLARTYTQYSSGNGYAAASFFGRAATVDFNANNSTITMKFKQEPGVAAELLTETQAATLKAKNCNAFVAYFNGTAIVQEGVMADGSFFDERQGFDWFQNELQTDVYNLLYQSPTKVPQTNAGMNLIASVMANTCRKAVNNGLVAGGKWNGPTIGQVATGDMLDAGFYIYVPRIEDQSQADREARKSVSFQILLKLAGAVHSVVCAVNVNR